MTDKKNNTSNTYTNTSTDRCNDILESIENDSDERIRTNYKKPAKECLTVDLNEKVLKYENFINTLSSFISEEDKKVLDSSIESLKKQKLSIIVVGEFDAGKSSFLNCILGEPILVTDVCESTAALTFLHHKDDLDDQDKWDLAKVTYLDKQKKPEYVTKNNLKDVTTSLQESSNVAESIERVDLYFDNDILKNNITIIDSPGTNGLKPNHEAITNKQISLSHAAIFVFSADQVGKMSEIELIKKLKNYAVNIFFVINKWDLKENLGENARSQFQNELLTKGIVNSSKDIYFLSSKNILELILDKNNNNNSNYYDFKFLLHDLSNVLNKDERMKVLIKQPLFLLKEYSLSTLNKLKQNEEEIKNYIDPEIEIEKDRITLYKQEIEEIFQVLEEQARNDFEYEIYFCNKEIRAYENYIKKEIIKSTIDEIQNSENLLSKDFEKQLQKKIELYFKDNIEAKVNQHFSIVINRISLDMESQTKMSQNFSFQPPELKSNNINIEQTKINSDDVEFKSKKKLLESELKILQSNNKQLNQDVIKGENAETQRLIVQDEINQIQSKIISLGLRPPKNFYVEKETYTKSRDLDGFFEKVFSPIIWWNGERVDDTLEREVKKEDDSKGLIWDIGKSILDKKINVLENKIESLFLIINESDKSKKKINLNNLQIRINKKELEILNDKFEEDKALILKAQLQDQKRLLIAKWNQEINNYFDYFTQRLTKYFFANNLNNQKGILSEIFLNFRKNQEKEIEIYTNHLNKIEKERLDKNNELQRDLQVLVKGIKSIENIIKELDKEIEELKL